MKRLVLVAGVLALLAAGPDRARAGFVVISSDLSLEADANAGGNPVTDKQSQSQGATTGPLAVTVDAISTAAGNAFVESTATGSASWTSPNVGHVLLSNVGWTVRNVSAGDAVLDNGLDYTYTFTPDVSGTMTLTFNVTAAGTDTFGLNGFEMFFGLDHQRFGLNTSGTVTESVVAGTTYTLRLQNQANISSNLGTRDAHMTGTFDFDIPTGVAAVPEPASLTLLGVGLVALGGYGLRRKGRRAP